MRISFDRPSPLSRRRIAPICVVAALAWALLSAMPANAETDASGVPTAPPAAEAPVPAPVQQISSAPVEQPQTASATEAPVPTEPPKVEEVASVDTGSDGGPSPAPEVSVPRIKDVASSVPSPSDAARSAGVDTEVDIPSGDESDAIVGRVGGVVEETRKDSVSEQQISKVVAGVRRGSAGAISAVTERLAAVRGELGRLPAPGGSGVLGTAEAQPSAGTQAGEGTSGRPAGFLPLQQHTGLLPNPNAVDPRLTRTEYPADAAILEPDLTPSSAVNHWKLGLAPRTGVFETTFDGTRSEPFNRPAPSDLPPPAPHSPTTAVPDGGGTSFVPIVALLALLALAAPAALRRLGRAADFRPPIPFVCALERPG